MAYIKVNIEAYQHNLPNVRDVADTSGGLVGFHTLYWLQDSNNLHCSNRVSGLLVCAMKENVKKIDFDVVDLLSLVYTF